MLRLCIVVFPRLFAETEGTFHTQADNKSRPVRSESVRGGGNVLFLYGTTTVFSFSVFRRDSFLRRIRDFWRLEKPRLCIVVFPRLFAETEGTFHTQADNKSRPDGASPCGAAAMFSFCAFRRGSFLRRIRDFCRGRRRCLFLCGAARVAGRCPRHTGAVHFSVGSGAFAGAGGVFGAATWDLRRRSFRPYHRIVSTSRTPQKT